MAGKVTRLLKHSLGVISPNQLAKVHANRNRKPRIWPDKKLHKAKGHYGDFFFWGGGVYIWNQFRVFHPGYFAHTWRVCECKRPWMWSKPITLQLLTSVKQSLKFRFAVGFFGWFSCMFKVTGISFDSVTISYLLVCIGHPSPHLKTNKWRLTGGRQN